MLGRVRTKQPQPPAGKNGSTRIVTKRAHGMEDGEKRAQVQEARDARLQKRKGVET